MFTCTPYDQCQRTVDMQMWYLIIKIFISGVLKGVLDYVFTFLTLVCNVAVWAWKHLQSYDAQSSIIIWNGQLQ